MQENFDDLLDKLDNITREVALNIGHFSNRLGKISGVANTQLNKFKNAAVFKACAEQAQNQDKLAKEFEVCNLKLVEFLKIPSNAPEYRNKLEELIDFFQLTNLSATKYLQELDQLEREVSKLAERQGQENQANYDKAKAALENEARTLRNLNQPIKNYIQGIDTTIQELEKNGVDASLLTTSKNILQQSRQTIQQALSEANSADEKIKALASNPPTTSTLVEETKSINLMAAKLKAANKQAPQTDYSQLSIAEDFVNVLKDGSDLVNNIPSIDESISNDRHYLEMEPVDEETSDLLQRNIIAKDKLENENKELSALNEEISRLNQGMSTANLQDPMAAQKIYDSIQKAAIKTEQIKNNISPIQESVENISKQVRERKFAQINVLKQKVEEIKAKQDESNKILFRDHEKEINEKIQDFNKECQDLENDFDNLTSADQKSKIEKLETLVHELEGFISGRYHLMADSYHSFERDSKERQAEITRHQNDIFNIEDKQYARETRLDEVNREIENNTAQKISKTNIENRILTLEKELKIGNADRVNPIILVPKTDRLDSNVQKLKEDTIEFISQLDALIQVIENELANGALGQKMSETAQAVFGALAGPEYAKEIGEQWGINEENERRNKITNVLNEAKEIRDELLKIDENHSGQLSNETYAKAEALINRLNEKASTLNQLITKVQEGINQIEAGLRKLLGQTSVKKEAPVFDRLIQSLCVKASKLLKRMRLQSDYRDWRAFHDKEPDRLKNLARLENEQTKLINEEAILEKDLSEANKIHEQRLNEQAKRQNPLRDIEWPLTYQNEEGNTLVHKAVLENNVEMLELFLRQSGQMSFSKEVLDIQNDQGKTPVDIALELENVSVINLLMKSDYPIDRKRWQSIVHSHPQLISQFAQTHDIETYTRHHVDFMADREFWMKALMNSANSGTGFLLDARDTNGNTLLHAAVQSRDLEDLNWLLTKGARMDLENKQAYTAIDLMKKENESDREQKANEKNQAYLGMSVYGAFFLGGIAMLAAAVIIGSTPIGWALGIAAVVVGLLSAPALIEKLFNLPETSSSPFPAIPAQETETLTVDSSILPHLGKVAESSKLSDKSLKLKAIDSSLLNYLDKGRVQAYEIEVLPGTKALIEKLKFHKNEGAKEIVPNVKVLQALQSSFRALQQNLNKFVEFEEFLTAIKQVKPGMLQEIDDNHIDLVLGAQIIEVNQINENMKKADFLLKKAVDHLMKYEFKQFENEFSKFKQFMSENNLVDKIKQVDEQQKRENEILEKQVLNVRRELIKDIAKDITYFESVKREFAVYKNKQDFFNSHLPLNAEVQNVNEKINDEQDKLGPMRLVALGEIRLDNIKAALNANDPALANELRLFRKTIEVLKSKVNEIAQTQQQAIEANPILDLMPNIKHLAQLKNVLVACQVKQLNFQNALAEENKDPNLIVELEKINQQIQDLEQSIAVAEKETNEAKEDPEKFDRYSGRESFRALVNQLENDLQQIVVMQQAIEDKMAPSVEEESLHGEYLTSETSVEEILKAAPVVEEKQPQPEPLLEGPAPSSKGLEAKKEFPEKRKESEKADLPPKEQESRVVVPPSRYQSFKEMRAKFKAEKLLDEQAAQKESSETPTQQARGNGLR